MIMRRIINTKIYKKFYYITSHFTKMVSKIWEEKKVVYKKITSTHNLVKSEIFIYNKKIPIQSFTENLTLD